MTELCLVPLALKSSACSALELIDDVRCHEKSGKSRFCRHSAPNCDLDHHCCFRRHTVQHTIHGRDFFVALGRLRLGILLLPLWLILVVLSVTRTRKSRKDVDVAVVGIRTRFSELLLYTVNHLLGLSPKHSLFQQECGTEHTFVFSWRG